jgi:anthranilate phosphoribosyltransferase
MRDLLEKIVSTEGLSEHEARQLLDEMTSPDVDQVVAGAALAALRVKGETADEVRGFALRLRELAIRPDIPEGTRAVDVVGTGGDGSGSLNLSTGSALLAAAAGAPVIKHGNRSISSNSGSADALEALGLQIPLDDAQAVAEFQATGFTFLFAPAYHPAMKSIAPVRAALGLRTIFNVAGPLANPATPPFHVIGAYSLAMARVMADTLAGMPIERAFVVHGEPGWDEATPIGPYHLLDVRPGEVSESIEDPKTFGFARCDASDLAGSDPVSNAAQIRAVFEGERSPHRDALVLGASLALRVMGDSPAEAIERVSSSIDDGTALRLVDGLKEVTHV